MGRLLLVLGGARSGKSAYAQRLAQELGGDDVLFVATAEAWDEDMAQRIARHRQERPATWRTLETRSSTVGSLLTPLPPKLQSRRKLQHLYRPVRQPRQPVLW